MKSTFSIYAGCGIGDHGSNSWCWFTALQGGRRFSLVGLIAGLTMLAIALIFIRDNTPARCSGEWLLRSQPESRAVLSKTWGVPNVPHPISQLLATHPIQTSHPVGS